MALQPSLKPLLIAGSPGAPHTLEFFRAYTNPVNSTARQRLTRKVHDSRLRLPVQQKDCVLTRQIRHPAPGGEVQWQGEDHLPQPGAAVARELDIRA